MLSSILFGLLVNTTAFAVPAQLSQHGRLMDSQGLSVNGTHGMTFRIYDDVSTGSLLWQEIILVDFSNGYYKVTLGENPNTNPLGTEILSLFPLYLEIELDNNGPLLPRQPLNSAPYAKLAEQAERLEGGTVDATQISIGGNLVIDGSGSWVGPTVSVNWSNIIGVPADILDGDADTLSTLSCLPSQTINWNGNSWICANDNSLSESDVENFIVNDPIDLAAGSSAGGLEIVTIASDQDSFAELGMSCSNWEIPRWYSGLGEWVCEPLIDTDTQLSESEVETFVTNAAVDLHPGSSVGGDQIVTAGTDQDTWLSESQVEDHITNGALDLYPGTTLNGYDIVTSENCSVSGILTYNTSTGIWECTSFQSLIDVDSDNVMIWNDCDDNDATAYDFNGQSSNCPAASCKDILDRGHSLGDGVYWINPNNTAPYEVHCDMANGGWTLAMRFADASSTFTFNSPYWLNASVLNESNPSPTASGDAKYMSFNNLDGNEIRGCLRDAGSTLTSCKDYTYGDSTLRELFSNTPIGSDTNVSGGLYFNETDSERLDWLTIQGRDVSECTDSANGYIRTGINIDDDVSCYDARIRFGLVLNNQPNVTSLNDAAGFGASSHHTSDCDLNTNEDHPESIGAGLAAGTLYETSGSIWVR